MNILIDKNGNIVSKENLKGINMMLKRFNDNVNNLFEALNNLGFSKYYIAYLRDGLKSDFIYGVVLIQNNKFRKIMVSLTAFGLEIICIGLK